MQQGTPRNSKITKTCSPIGFNRCRCAYPDKCRLLGWLLQKKHSPRLANLAPLKAWIVSCHLIFCVKLARIVLSCCVERLNASCKVLISNSWSTLKGLCPVLADFCSLSGLDISTFIFLFSSIPKEWADLARCKVIYVLSILYLDLVRECQLTNFVICMYT